LIVLALAALLFSINLGRPPDPDELHHVLAAQHLFETGRPMLADGEYWRGIIHTWMVATSYALFGESLTSARIPPVVLVALTAPILFLWVRREAGRLAAWLTALLFISSPFTVSIAQFSRFYGLQVFSFVLACACLYYAMAERPSLPRRVGLGVLAVGLFFLAVSAQITTLVGLVGVGAWVVGILVQRVLLNPAASRGARASLVAMFVAAGALGVAALVLTDLPDMLWDNYRGVPLWGEESRNDFWFYHLRFLLFYPTLWSLVGVLAVLAVLHSPRLAWYGIAIFSCSFLLMSFAAFKSDRYLSFAPPFLAIVWGMGLAHAVPALQRSLHATWSSFKETLTLPQGLRAIASTVVAFFIVAIVVLTNPFWLRTATVIADVAVPGEVPVTNWEAGRDALAPWTAAADIMITTEELGAIYFLGRSDVGFNPSKMGEIGAGDEPPEFSIDPRTGRPLVSTPESLERLIECFPRGFIVGPANDWGREIFITEPVQAVIENHAQPIEVPAKSHLFAWGWNHEPRAPQPSYCSELSRFSRRSG
jgi:4-amino-4-deoxy-L-arabinose transferase-like glycosyltransferase